MTEKERLKRITRSALIFRALEEIGSQEIQVLQGTTIDKGKVKVELKRVRRILDSEYLKDVENHSTVDTNKLKELRSEEAELLKLGEGATVTDRLEISKGEQSVEVNVSVIEKLRKIREERAEILNSDDIAFGAYHAMLGLIERISLEVTKLDIDQVIDFDLLLDKFLKGEIKFVGE